MKAREMFEELGYTYQESYFKNELNEIRYTLPNKFGSCVTFNLGSKCFRIHRCDDEYKSAWADTYLLKVINKQIEELGWDE